MDMSIHSHQLGTLGRHGAVLGTSEPFVLVGLQWHGPVRARIELRARTGTGRWTPWTLASVQGHDSDGGESVALACFGEPVWTGEATELELRSPRRVEGLSVHLVPAAPISGAARGHFTRRGPQGGTSSPALPLAQPTLAAGPGQPPIIAREAWAGNRGPATAPSYGDVRMMFVHHSVNANGYSAAEVPALLLSIYEFHRYVRGWNDIGYNFAIDAFGRVWEARAGGIDQAVVGAQAGGYNLESAGVVMLGTFGAQLPTRAALSTLARLLAWKLSLHGVPVSGTVTVEVDPTDAFYTAFRPGQHVTLPRIAGHRDGCTTDCPGAELYAHLPVVRADVRALVGRQFALSLGFAPGQRAVAPRYLSLAAAQVTAGESVALSGRLLQLAGAQTGSSPSGVPVANTALELQSLISQVEGAVDGSQATGGAGVPFTLVTDSGGGYALQFSPSHNLLVRVLTSTAPVVASPLVAVAVAPAVTLTVAGAAPLRLTGSVMPHKAQLELLVQSAGGAHAPVRHEIFTPRSDGTFQLTPRLPRGSYTIAVIARADAENVQGRSPRIHVTV
jgi:hypothetical protein